MKRAMRFNKRKPKYSLMDLDSFEPMVRVLEFGSIKYERDNWKRGMPVTEILDSTLRHIAAIGRGEDVDPESGILHISHLQCNAMFLAHTLKNHPEWDDRATKVKLKGI